jgi:predicted nucleotidyltransferase
MINIEEKDKKIIDKILREYLPNKEIRVFGSRITEKVKKYSDLDLAIVGEEQIEFKLMNKLIEEFEYSDLNIRVDILDYNSISENFRRIIDKNYEIWR